MLPNQSNILKEIDVLLRARYPLIYCESFEEARWEAAFYEQATARGNTLFSWSLSAGLLNTATQKKENITDPEKVLRIISDHRDPGLFLLKDFHPFLKDPLIVRLLRDLANELKQTRKNILFLSPVLFIPPELMKECIHLKLPVPTRDEIESTYRSITKQGDSDPSGRESAIEASLGLTLDEIENAFAKSLVKHGHIDPQEILLEKKQIVQKSGILEFIGVKEGFDAIGGLATLKDWLKKRKQGFSQAARSFQLPAPKGLLLVGLPGCGKSLTAACLSAAWQIPLLKLDMGRIYAGLVGSSEANLRSVITTAENVSPCILWIDEIEKALSGSSGGGGDGGTATRVFGTLLTWMQEKTSQVFIFATSNDISGLPPELLRKGRFDEIFFVDFPSEEERKSILSIHLKKRGWSIADIDWDLFSALSIDFSGAEIEQALIDAAYDAFFFERDLGMSELEQALRRLVPISRTMSEKIGQIKLWAKERALSANTLLPLTHNLSFNRFSEI